MRRGLYCILLAAPLGAWAAGAPAKSGVDWQGQVLTAQGQGAPNMRATSPAQARLGAERAAKLDAFRQLLEQVKGLQLSSDKTVGDEMADTETRSHIEGVIRGFKITGKHYYSDQGVAIDVEVPLSGVLAALPPPPSDPLTLHTDGAASTSGLIVDARGLKVTPALEPRLVDPDGQVLYAVAALSEDARAKTTPAAYFPALAAAKKSPRAGDHPRVVKAVAVKGADLVLSKEDAAAIRAENDAYLAQGNVAIVADAKVR